MKITHLIIVVIISNLIFIVLNNKTREISNLENPHKVTIPITYGKYFLHEAPIKIMVGDNLITYDGIIDTGASYSHLPLAIANKLIEQGNAEVIDKGYYSGVSEDDVGEMYIINVSEIHFGNCVLKNVKFGVTQNSNLIIIGNSTLERFGLISIDYKANILTAKSCPVS